MKLLITSCIIVGLTLAGLFHVHQVKQNQLIKEAAYYKGNTWEAKISHLSEEQYQAEAEAEYTKPCRAELNKIYLGR